MKRALLILVLTVLMTVPALAETTVMVITDPHYLADTLYVSDSPFLYQVLRASDGRMTQYSSVLMEALKAEVRHQRPDALIVTGDLTYNGEYESHEQLAAHLKDIVEEGTPVWVIPGNHDINVPNPVGFSEYGSYPVSGINEEDFELIYHDLMRPPEGEKGANLSYHAAISDTLWIAMADAACYSGTAYTNGIFTDAHAVWLEKVLQEARGTGAQVITASHHNLFVHSQYQKEFYVLGGSDRLLALKEQYQSVLHLSGHLHIQHLVKSADTVDAATAAFTLYPHYYALVTLGDDGSLTYQACSLCEEHLPDGFMETSKEWFLSTAKNKSLKSLSKSGLDEGSIDAMADFSARFNLSYFSGTLMSSGSWLTDPGYLKWQTQSGTYADYIKTVVREAAEDHLFVHIPSQDY